MSTCEVCGADATCEVSDIRETAPVQAEDGTLYQNWERVGEPHSFCEAHRHIAKVIERPELRPVI